VAAARGHAAERQQRLAPLVPALVGGDERAEGDAVGAAALRQHLVEALPRLLPVPAW
jgi:hypothetical protein